MWPTLYPPTPSSFQGERAKEVMLIVIFWVVSRCVFAWFGGVFCWWFAVAAQSGRCLGGVTSSSFRAAESDVREFSWVVWRRFGFGACPDGGSL